jgi:hypothetical protein
MLNVDDILYAPIKNNEKRYVNDELLNKIPSCWLDVLKKITSVSGWEKSVIVGGALRDLENGRQIKDVDIFVPFLDNDTAAMSLKNFVCGNIPLEEYEPQNNYGGIGISRFIFVLNGWKFEITQKINFIDIQSIYSGFDIGLCMISIDKDNVISRSPEYIKDVRDNTLTIVKLLSQEHIDRVHEKYSEWKIIYP